MCDISEKKDHLRTQRFIEEVCPERMFPGASLNYSDEFCLWKYGRGLTVEIGTFLGGSSSILAMHADKVITMDRFTGRMDYPDFTFESTCKNLEPWPNVKVLKGDAQDLVTQFADESIDVMNIDGSHMYNDVKNDFEAYLPKVKKDGIIIFHDYAPIWEDVERYVDELKAECTEVEFVELIMWCAVFVKKQREVESES